jgi:hypothetical protein
VKIVSIGKLLGPFVLLPLAILAFVRATTPLTESASGLSFDGRFYAAMAERATADITLSHHAPWCWRVLTPFLASLLPFSTLTDFTVLAFFSGWVNLALVYSILRKNRFSSLASVIGVLFYAGVFWSIKFSFYSPAYVDYQTQTFILAGMLLIVLKKYWPLPFLVTLAVLQKESLILLAWIAYADYSRSSGWLTKRSLSYLAILLFFPLIVVMLVRMLILSENFYSSMEAFLFYAGLHAALFTDPRHWPRLVLALFSGLGILPVILLCRVKTSCRFLQENPCWMWLIVVGTLQLGGGIDKARLLLFILPAMVVLATNLVDKMLTTPSARVWAWIAVTLGLHFYLGHHFTPMGTVDEYVRRMVPMHAPRDAYPMELARIGVVVAVWVIASILCVAPRWLRKVGRTGDT